MHCSISWKYVVLSEQSFNIIAKTTVTFLEPSNNGALLYLKQGKIWPFGNKYQCWGKPLAPFPNDPPPIRDKTKFACSTPCMIVIYKSIDFTWSWNLKRHSRCWFIIIQKRLFQKDCTIQTSWKAIADIHKYLSNLKGQVGLETKASFRLVPFEAEVLDTKLLNRMGAACLYLLRIWMTSRLINAHTGQKLMIISYCLTKTIRDDMTYMVWS